MVAFADGRSESVGESLSRVLLADLGLSLAYGLYAAMAALSFVFVWRFVSETKGMELEEMTDALSARRSPRRTPSRR